MDCAEKPFLKKVPKTDKTDPKRLKKDLPKLVKSIGPEDQVRHYRAIAVLGVVAGEASTSETLRLSTTLPRNAMLQVLLMGVSRCPWECDQKALAQVYTKIILIPRPDYASRSYIWSELLFSYSGVNRQFDTAAMAQISDGYTVRRQRSNVPAPLLPPVMPGLLIPTRRHAV